MELPANYYKSRQSLIVQHLCELHGLKRHILNEAEKEDSDIAALVNAAIGLIKVQIAELERQDELIRAGQSAKLASKSRIALLRNQHEHTDS